MVEKWSRKGLRIRFRAHPAIRRLSVVSWALPGHLLGNSWAAFRAPGGPLGPVVFFFKASWAALGAVLPLSWTPWAPLPTVLGRSWRLLEHLGHIKSRWQGEIRIVRFTIVKPLILRMREPSMRVLRGLLDASVTIPAHLSKRDRLFATFVRSLAPLGPLLAASWGVLGRLKIVLGRLGGGRSGARGWWGDA